MQDQCPECDGTIVLLEDGYMCDRCFILTEQPVFDHIVISEPFKSIENLTNYAHKRLKNLIDQIPVDLKIRVIEIYEHLKTVHTGENIKRKNFYKSQQLLRSILLNLGRKDMADKFNQIKDNKKRLEVHSWVTLHMRHWSGQFDYCASQGWVVDQVIESFNEPKSSYNGIYSDR